MRIACLITVCAALTPTIYTLEYPSRTRRRQVSREENRETAAVGLQPRHAYVSEETESGRVLRSAELPSPWKMQDNLRLREYAPRYSRRIRRSHPPDSSRRGFNSKRSNRGRSRRQLRTKTIELGRSYDVNENHLETIQSPEMFEDGAIHIEPVYRLTKKKTILDEFVDLVRRAIIPPKNHLGPLVGPFNFPGVGDKIYIRLLEPVNSNRLVIRLVTHLPVSEIESPFESGHFASVKPIEIPDLSPGAQHLFSELFASSTNQRRHVHHPVGLHAASSNVVKISKPVNAGKLDGTRIPVSTKNVQDSRVHKLSFKYGDARYHPDPNKTGLRSFVPQYAAANQHPQVHNNQMVKHGAGQVVKLTNGSEGSQFTGSPEFREASFYPYHSAEYEHRYPSSTASTFKIEDSEAKESLNPLHVVSAESSAGSKVTRNSRVVSSGTGQAFNSYSDTDTAFQIITPPTLTLRSTKPAGPPKIINYIYTNDTVESWKPDISSDARNRTIEAGFKPIHPTRIFRPSASASKDDNWEPVRSAGLAVESANPAANIRTSKISEKAWPPEPSWKVVSGKQTPKKTSTHAVPTTTQHPPKSQKKPGKNDAGQTRKKSLQYEEYEYIGEPIYIEYYEEKAPSLNATRPTISVGTLKPTTRSAARAMPLVGGIGTSNATTTTKPPVSTSTAKNPKYNGTRTTAQFNESPKYSVTPNTTAEAIVGRTTKKPAVSTTTKKPISTTRKITISGLTKRPVTSTTTTTTTTTEKPVFVNTTKKPMLFGTMKKFPGSGSTRKPFGTTMKKSQITGSTTMRPTTSITGKRPMFGSTTQRTTIVYPSKRPPIFNSTRALAFKSRYMNRQNEIKNGTSTSPKPV